ncbi:MAG: isochorismate synthase [bacterium]|nr:isochorismate synthase [bacterium]
MLQPRADATSALEAPAPTIRSRSRARRRAETGRQGDVDRFVEYQLARHAGRDRMVVLTVPAPRVEAEALLDVGGRRAGFFWHPGGGAAHAGFGAAHVIQVCGPGRFGQLRLEAERLWRRLAVARYGADPPLAPRLFGGLAFDVGAAADEPWTQFGDGCFVLPRFSYRRDARRTTLSLAVRGEELAGRTARAAWRRELRRLLAELADGGRAETEAAREATGDVRVHPPSRRRWIGEVEAILAAIARGDFAKIVAAHSALVDFAAPLEVSSVLRRLATGGAIRFAFRRRHGTFLGATPERLIRRRGRRIETEALAGSIGRGDGCGARLLASVKDRLEHRLVVDEIRRRLEPLCRELSLEAAPGIRELRDVLHLRTPITGTLAAPRHVLDLVEALHPTPAVGGVPTSSAMRWIDEHESGRRGWYASPIGWFDAAGDGDFAVALRSCVLRGSEAHLYAGAGIVADSDPRLEYHETELKQRALLAALGA